MADETVPINEVIKNEGGYAAPFGKSGETYMGIDRLHQPSWPGWVIIDNHKITVGPISNKTVLNNSRLYQLVFNFYKNKFWPASKAGLLKNQPLANMYFDFYFHKPAIAVAALKKASGKTSLGDAIAHTNKWPEHTYSEFFKLRVLHYKNLWMNGSGRSRIYYKPGRTGSQAGVLRRAYRYPKSIDDSQNFVSVDN